MKVLVLGAGGAAANGFARALKRAGGYELVGTNCSPDDLLMSECDVNHRISHVSDLNQWRADLLEVVKVERPDFVHAQADAEVAAVGRFRDRLHMIGWRADHPDGRLHTFLPRNEVLDVCRDKWASYLAWKRAGVPVPETMLAERKVEMRNASGTFKVWVRPRVGAGGQRSLASSNPDLVRMWLDRHDGWGNFTVAEALSSDTVTVQTLWWNGELVGSQQRTRVSWANAGSTTTGVSGSTGIGVTSSDEETDATAMLAVGAVDDLPHGLYGVDMTRREDGTPCVTEINCGRFFTTAPEFYAQAGYNMAQFYVEMGQPTDRRGAVARAVDLTAYTDARDSRNPLPDGLRWIRAMDRPPILDRTQVREQVPA